MMKKFFSLILLITIIASCTGGNNIANEYSALIEDNINAVQKLDYNLIDACFSEDYVDYPPPLIDSIGKSNPLERTRKKSFLPV